MALYRSPFHPKLHHLLLLCPHDSAAAQMGTDKECEGTELKFLPI